MKHSKAVVAMVLVLLALFSVAAYHYRSITGSAVGKDYNSVGMLKIISFPAGASVILDGEVTQQMTPYVNRALGPGTHHLRLTRDGYEEYVTDFNTLANQMKVLQPVLRKKGK